MDLYFLYGFGELNFSPLASVASVLIPKSTPVC